MSQQPLSNKQDIISILRGLMEECGLKEAELARQTGLPQTTINRLLLGGTSDPRANTLKPIADFFGITIGQLCGFEPLATHRIPGSTNPIHRSAWQPVPIIEWNKIKSWVFNRRNITPLNHLQWVATERPVSQYAFALTSLSFMEPRFRKDSLLIVDPEAEYKDGHFVIIALDGLNPTVRRILKDGSEILLKTFDQTQPPLQLEKKHVIYGTIVESRMDTYNHR